MIWVTGLGEALKDCYKREKLPHELGIEWAKAGQTVDLSESELFQLINNL